MAVQMNRLSARVTLVFFCAIAALRSVLAASFAFMVYTHQRTNVAVLRRATVQRVTVPIGGHLDSLRAPFLQAPRLETDLPRATSDEQPTLLDNLPALNSFYPELAWIRPPGPVIATAARAGHHEVCN